ncbi:MAG: hypothetical protein JJ895_15960 [Balneolaceae bacterium]|nr:hypothetical protein [Balneolaceae bacterium]
MQGIEEQVGLKAQPQVKKGTWEVIITDPSLNKFTFGPSLISRYIMTDIISPYGQKSILYNTIPSSNEDTLVIKLNFENVDDCNISDIKIRSSRPLFQKWEVKLIDNRTGEVTSIQGDEDFQVEPPIQYNKLFSMGFILENQKKGDHFFELHLTQKHN